MDNKLKYDDLKLQGINVDEGFTYTGSSEKYLAALQRFLRRAEKTRTAITDSIGNEDYEGLTAQAAEKEAAAAIAAEEATNKAAETVNNAVEAGTDAAAEAVDNAAETGANLINSAVNGDAK